MTRVPRIALLALAGAIACGPVRPVSVRAGEPVGPSVEATDDTGRIGADIVDLYDRALAHLEKACDDYRRIKAIQLARGRDIPFAEAYETISSVMPVPEPINRELLRKSIRDPRDITRHKAEVEQVRMQVEAMIDLLAKLLQEIEVVRAQLMEQDGAMREFTLEEIVQKPEYDPEAMPPPEPRAPRQQEFATLEEAAREDPEEPARDLTPLMHRLMPDILDLTSELRDEAEIPKELFQSGDDLGALASIVDPSTHATFGRKVVVGGTPAEWMFVDSWYTIGPFANPQRLNIHRKFPPETVIDLDATYTGKDGKEIRWQWVQSNEPMVTPADPAEYAIYYGYTEVYCDRPMDLWVAVGSDDKANVWLNGMPIWISSDELKGWRVNEGFRKVTFKAGRNKVLYRVENGWLNLGFSMGIRVAP